MFSGLLRKHSCNQLIHFEKAFNIEVPSLAFFLTYKNWLLEALFAKCAWTPQIAACDYIYCVAPVLDNTT